MGRNVQWRSHFGKQSGKRLNVELAYDPAIPLPGKLTTYAYTKACIQLFIASLLIIAETGKQPKYPSTDERKNKMWYTHTKEYCSTRKKLK